MQPKKPDQKVQQAPRHSKTLPTWAGLGNKTIWDWVSLLLLPIVLTVGGLIFTGRQAEHQQELEDQRAARELHLADQVAQDKALQAYLDQMSELIQAQDLLACENACWETIALAQARTETVIQRLDADHNRSVVRFLNGADLLGKEDLLGDDPSALSLFESADLAEADLENTDLREVVLRESHLSEADLNQALLANADLGGADLTGAHLRNAQLQGTYLNYAELSNAELSNADLSNADLDGANLTGADLSGADLSGADITDTDLNNADLTDANLQGAYKYDYSGDEGNELVPRAKLEQQAKSLKGATMTNEEARPEEGANAQQPGTVAFTDVSGNTIKVTDVPPGWTSQISNAKEELTILSRNSDSNVIVGSEPLGSKFDTPRRYANAQGDLLREQLPEYHELTVEHTNVFGGDRGVRRVFTWDPKHGAPVTQIQQYYAENRRGYIATATAFSKRKFRRYEDDMQQVLANITLIRGLHDRVFEPTFRFEVGQEWEFASPGTIDQVFIQTGPNGGQLLFTNPHRVFDPSNLSASKELPAPENTAEWVAWFQRHPNLNTSKLAPESVGNASGKRIDVTLTSTPENYPQDICGEGSPCVPLYPLSENDSSIASYDGWKDRFVIVDVGGETVLINVSAPKDKFDKFLPKAQKVLDSVEWKGG